MFETNYMYRASDSSFYWVVPGEYIKEMMPVIGVKTVIICDGYVVWVTPKKYETQVPKEWIN